MTHHALILLGGGLSHYPAIITPQLGSYARILEAARIYHLAAKQHRRYTLFISGGDTLHNHSSEAAIYRDLLLQLGVPKSQIIIENRSLNTFMNAKNLKPLLTHYPYKSYLLVTSALHMKRAQAYFKFFGINTIAAPSDFPYPLKSIIPLSHNLALQDMAIHELVGIKRLWLYNLLDLNDK